MGIKAMLGEGSFISFAREERHFAAVLTHLLLTRGPNLATFLEIVNSRLPNDTRYNVSSLDDAEVYVEFTLLRDYWKSLGKDNERKRRFIAQGLERSNPHDPYGVDLPAETAALNAQFMGPRGARIANDIAYPGQWSVRALADSFRDSPERFRDLCRFKWAFNIKPDIVILIPGASPLCVEAKLESGEGSYPASAAECQIFDNVFGPGKRRVQQFELQQFMFDRLLQAPCHQVVLARNSQPSSSVPVITWEEAFGAIDLTASVPYVRQLIERNVYLRRRS